MKSTTTILAFTNNSYCYADSEENAIKGLRSEIAKTTVTSSRCWIADVSEIADDAQIIHEDGICSVGALNIETKKVQL